MRCEERQEEAETKREFDMWLIDISALRCGVWLADESFAELHSLISIWRVAWGRVTTPDYAACAHTRTQTHTHTQCRLPQIASLSFLGEKQGCQITGCHLHQAI